MGNGGTSSVYIESHVIRAYGTRLYVMRDEREPPARRWRMHSTDKQKECDAC